MIATTALAIILTFSTAAPAPDMKPNVEKGLKWLASQQKANGCWTCMGRQESIEATADAGLAFLMSGSTLREGRYTQELRGALAWMEKHVLPNGKAGHADYAPDPYMTWDASAMLFLACVYEVDDDGDRRKRIGRLLERMVAFAANCQTSRGGWSFIPKRGGGHEDHSLNTAEVLQSLAAARRAGIDVPQRAIDRGIGYLVGSTTRDGGLIYTLSNGEKPRELDFTGERPYSAAAAVAVLACEQPRPDQLRQWIGFARPNRSQVLRYTLLHDLKREYHMARLAYVLGERGHRDLDPRAVEPFRFSPYRAHLFKSLIDLQKTDGSWRDSYYGPAHTTALALVMLQLENDYLLAFSR